MASHVNGNCQCDTTLQRQKQSTALTCECWSDRTVLVIHAGLNDNGGHGPDGVSLGYTQSKTGLDREHRTMVGTKYVR